MARDEIAYCEQGIPRRSAAVEGTEGYRLSPGEHSASAVKFALRLLDSHRRRGDVLVTLVEFQVLVSLLDDYDVQGDTT